MDNATARKRRYRQRRRAGGTKAFEVWLPTALVDELKQPDESMNALVARALAALRHRTPDETGHTPAAPPVDTRPYDQRKAVILQRLRAMQAGGLSLQAIATRLNAEGVPTLSGRGRWGKGTIGDLLAQVAAPGAKKPN